MKRITTIFLMLAACVVNLSARELHAAISAGTQAGGNVESWVAATGTFTWKGQNDARILFTDIVTACSGDLSSWDELVIVTSGYTNSSYRIDFRLTGGTVISNGNSGSKTAFWSAGTKHIILSEVLTAEQRSQVAEIRLNTNSNSGSIVLEELYLVRNSIHTCEGIVTRASNQNCAYGKVFEWNASSANTRQLFSFEAGTLNSYDKLRITGLKGLTGAGDNNGWRLRLLYIHSSGNVEQTFQNDNDKDITLSDVSGLSAQLGNITEIAIGGKGASGSVFIDPANVILSNTSTSAQLVCSDLAKRNNNPNCDYIDNQFGWWAGDGNTMQLFSMSAGDLTAYHELEISCSSTSLLETNKSYRILFIAGSTTIATLTFSGVGTQKIALDDNLTSEQIASITEIAIGGNSGAGRFTIVADDIKLSEDYPIDYYAGTGEGITGSRARDYKEKGSKKFTLPRAVFSRPNYVQIGWATSDGGTQVYALGADYTTDQRLKLYPVWRPILTTQAAGNWSETATWAEGIVPTEIDTVVLSHTVTVDNATAIAKDVTIASGGQLIIEAANKLKVVNQIRKWTGSAYAATDAADIIIDSSADGNGALIMGGYDGSEVVKATVNFYSISGGSINSAASVNQYVGTPFSDANVLYNWYNSWIYRLNDAGTAWERINGSSVMNPFEGYNVIYNGSAGHVYEMEGTLVPTTDRVITLTHTSDGAENVLANSWTAPIKISAIDAGSFVGADATIYIFNAGSPNDYSANGSSSGTLAGQYQTIPVAGSIPSGYDVIPSLQSFSVNAASGESHTLTLDYGAVVYDVASSTSVQPNHAPRKVQSADSRSLIVRVCGASGWGDEVRLYANENFTTNFDNGYDGRKMYGAAEAPCLYVQSEEGEMAVAAVPSLEGTTLAFAAGTADDQYTFSFEYEDDEPLYLLDTDMNTYTPVQSGNIYSFTAADKATHTRFVLTRRAPQVTTGNCSVNLSCDEETKVAKVLNKGAIYIIRNGEMYNIIGKRVQ